MQDHLSKERLDQLLVTLGLVNSRSQAAPLIKDGLVSVDGKVITKPSFKCGKDQKIEIHKEYLYVGRGAEKMEGAFKDFNLSFEDKVVGDMGASTGGFTEFALLHGASKVYAVDVGHDQLASKLVNDHRVLNLEGTNIRDGLSLDIFNPLCDIIVVDLSFISLCYVIESMAQVLKQQGEFVMLVKPQFEVGKEALGKNGIVRNTAAVDEALAKVRKECARHLLSVEQVSPCAIKGKTGNQEYFFYGHKLKGDSHE